jgi:opacity protein-like surface antigen
LLGCSLLSTQALAASKNIYIGIDILGSTNTKTISKDGYTGVINPETDSNAFKFKVGTVLEDGYKTQFYYLQEDYEDAPFDATNDTLSEIGIDFIKEVELSTVLYPYAQVGIGYGWMETDSSDWDGSSMSEFNAKAGVGLMFKVAPELEIVTGVDYQYRKWSDRETVNGTIKTDEQSTRYYIGTNYNF